MDGTHSDDMPTDDNKDFHENHVLTYQVIYIILVVSVGRLGAYRRHSGMLPFCIPIRNLKEVVETMVKIPKDNQEWFYKNRQLENSDTLQSIQIKKNAIIEVKRVLP